MDVPYGEPMLLEGAVLSKILSENPQDSSSEACAPQAVLRNREAFSALWKEYLWAGCGTLLVPSSGASEARLEPFGLASEADALNADLAALTKNASGGKPVGGCLSSAGIELTGDSEHTFSELMGVYSGQAAALKRAGIDYFYLDAMPSLTDVRAAALACRKQRLPVFATVSVDNEGRTASGTSASACLVVLQELGVAAFGLSGGLSPEEMQPLYQEMAAFTKIPLIARPAAFREESDDLPALRLTPERFADGFRTLFENGVRIAGGGEGTTPAHIAALGKEMDSFDFKSVSLEHHSRDLVLTSVHDTFLYDLDLLEFSPTVIPSDDMSDDFVAIEEESYDVISVEIQSPEEALTFVQNAHMADLPVSFLSDDELALKTVLLSYPGRAMVDARSSIDREVLEQIAYKYGAVLY